MKNKILILILFSGITTAFVTGSGFALKPFPLTLGEAGYQNFKTNSARDNSGGGWLFGQSMLIGARYYGGYATYTRNDTTWLYISGGDTSGSGHPSRTVMRYNFRTTQWNIMAPMPVPLRNHSAAVIGNNMYIFGGLNSPTSNGVKTAYKYNILLNTWTSIPDLPDTLFLLSAAAVNDSLLVIGGGVTPIPDSRGFIEARELWAYNTIREEYILLALLPFAIADPSIFITPPLRNTTGKAYVIGGFKAGGAASADVIEVNIDYTTPSNSTSNVRTNVFPGGGIGRHIGVMLKNGNIIISGGSRTQTFAPIANHYMYNPAANVFTPLPNSNIPLCAHYGGVAYSGNAYQFVVTGGITTGPALSSSTLIYADTITTSISQISGNIPDRINLYQNFPNPFNPSTKIRFDISSVSDARENIVELAVYNSLGKREALLVKQELQPGSYEYTFDAANLSSGIYYYTLRIGEYMETKKMLLVK